MTMKPPHPGETIKEEYIKPLGMSVTALAKELGIGAARLNEIVRGRRSVTADTALRLARYFGTTPELWLNLQSFYDLRMAQRKAGRAIERQVTPRQAEQLVQGREDGSLWLSLNPPTWQPGDFTNPDEIVEAVNLFDQPLNHLNKLFQEIRNAPKS